VPGPPRREDSQYHPAAAGRCDTDRVDTPAGDLGALLRAWRDRLSPLDVGLPAGDQRRARGLRREELAALAGLSVDYVVRLEQGRAQHPSAQVAASLARALQLSDVERDHLFVLAGLVPPSPSHVPEHVPPGVQRLVARLGETPVAVFTASWDLLSWSPLWGRLFGEPVGEGGERPNLLRSWFGGTESITPGERVEHGRAGGLRAFEASLVADLRRVHGRYPGDPRVRRLIDDMTAASPTFRELWSTGAVGEHVSERKVVRHPVVGDVELDCDVLTVAGTDLRVIAYTAAAGSPASEALDFLRVAPVPSGVR